MSRKLKLRRLQSAFAVYKERQAHCEALKEEQCDWATGGDGRDGGCGLVRAKRKELRRKKRGRRVLEGHSEEGASEDSSVGMQQVRREVLKKKRKRMARMTSKKKRARIEVTTRPEVQDVESPSEEDSLSSVEVGQSDTDKAGTEKGIGDDTSEEGTGSGVEMAEVPLGSEMVHRGVSLDVDVPFFKTFNPELFTDREMAAKELFKLLIKPFPATKFFQEVWEQRPMVLQRHKPYYNDGWFSTQEMDSILRQHCLEFSTNIDLTTYEDGKRRTHNPVGKATAHVVWEHFQAGCSVRLLNPQTYSKTMWLLNSTLQELFNSGVGANTYLTPAGSQGFSPHYDDIEAFILQLEGRKRWKLYKPRSENEFLPQFSSGNFTDADISEPIFEVELEAGDLLYFPRGYIHQASTPPDTHSLHVTVSTYQRNTWSDLFEKLLPAALELATVEDREFREGLPLDYLHHNGIVHSDSEGDRWREAFLNKMSHLFDKLLQYVPVDGAADQMGVKFLQEALPPVITKEERSRMVCSTGAKWEGRKVVGRSVKLSGESMVRLLSRGSVRLVMEGESSVLYSCVHNTLCPQEKNLVGTEVNDWESPGIDYLIKTYPRYTSVDSLPMEDGTTSKKVDLCDHLYKLELLIVQ